MEVLVYTGASIFYYHTWAIMHLFGEIFPTYRKNA